MMKLSYSKYLLLLATTCLLAFSCGPDNSPDDVAEAFLFRYFIELNQRGAMELSTGLAAKKLQDEIELTQNIRMEPNLDLSKHRPFLDYELMNQSEEDGIVTFFYEITVEVEGGPDRKSQFVLSTIELDGQWQVNNYDSFLNK